MKQFNPTLKKFLIFFGAVALGTIVQLLRRNHTTEPVRMGIGNFVMFEAMYPLVVVSIKKAGNKLSPRVLFLKYSIGAIVSGILSGLLMSL